MYKPESYEMNSYITQLDLFQRTSLLGPLGTGLLCLFFTYVLCYAAVFLKFTYYAQNYAQE